MAKLTAEQRKEIPNKEHAANAKARASEMENEGKLSEGQEEEIDAKANKILDKKKSRLDVISEGLQKAKAKGK